MTDAVTSGAEQTDQEESQTSEVESTNDELEAEDSSSSEDVNAQSEGDNEELEEQAMDEVKSDKGRNRVQELANRNRSLKQELELLRQQQLMQSRQVQPQSQGEYIEQELYRQRVELENTKEEIAWNEAIRQYPELEKGHPDYSPELADFVYSNYLVRRQKGEAVTPTEVAKEGMEFVNKLTQKAGGKSDVIREVKKTVSPIGGQRKPSGDEYNKYQATKSKFMQSGSTDDLAALFAE